MNAINLLFNHQPLKVIEGRRSAYGFWGAMLVLLMLPLALLYQVVFAYGSSTFVHWVLAAGAWLMAVAVFDFGKLSKWINRSGCLLAGSLAVIFFLQGLSDLLPNDAFTYLAYQVLGQALEGWLLRLFILFWCGALLFLDSQGKTRIFGWVALLVFIGVEVIRINRAYLGVTPNQLLKVFLLLPFVWLLLESKKQSRTHN